ncbi:hypothetical protein [Actinophytocola sp. KF-1]
MSIQGTPRVDRDTAELLAAGRGTGPVAVLLRAAAAPAHADELAGESAAVAAFRAAAVAPVPHRSVFRRSVAKALTIKAVLVVAVAGSTGVVLAASEGALPVPWSNTPAEAPGTTTTPATPAPNAPAGRTGDDKGSPATPDPSVAGLCEAYTAGGEKDLTNPAFRALVEAAGGKGEVADYCDVVTTTAPGAPATSGRPGEPGDDGDDDAGEDADEDSRPETLPVETPTQVGPPSTRPGVTEPPTDDLPTGDVPTKGKTDRPSRTARTTATETTSELTDEVAVTETPDSSAPGAASAVPPSGAEPPSKGS